MFTQLITKKPSGLIAWSGTPDDTFDGSDTDPARADYWVTSEDNATIQINSNKLRFSSSGGVDSPINSITSKFILGGDFNIQVGFTLITQADLDWQMSMRVFDYLKARDQTYCLIARERLAPAINRGWGTRYGDGVLVNPPGSTTLGDTSNTGVLKLSRATNDFGIYWPNSGAFVNNVTIPEAAGKFMKVEINLDVDNSVTVIDMNDFVINSADSIWQEV